MLNARKFVDRWTVPDDYVAIQIFPRHIDDYVLNNSGDCSFYGQERKRFYILWSEK